MEDFVSNIEPVNTKYTIYRFVSGMTAHNVSEIQATSICSKENLIFVGTNYGVVLQLMFHEVDQGFTAFSYYEVLSKAIFSKAIDKLHCTKTYLLAVMSDDNLCVRNAENLETLGFIPQFNDVTSFHLSSNSNLTKLAISFKSGSIQLYHITPPSCFLVFDHKLMGTPQNICASSHCLCIALTNSYISINLKTKAITEVLHFNKDQVHPFISHVTQNEFIVLGPSSLAIIVDANGSSHRPPIQLSCNVLDVFVWQHYLFTLTDEFFTIHNILTQMQLQTVVVKSPTAVSFSADSHLLFVITNSTLSKDKLIAIGPERWDVIARSLILAKCIKQASQLMTKEEQRVHKLLKTRPEIYQSEKTLFNVRRQRLHGVLGFHYFELGALQQAGTHFEQSLMDIREILYRYNDLLPKGYYFNPNWFYRLHPIDGEINDQVEGSGINLVSDLCVLKASEDAANETDLSSTSTWLLNYQRFLFNFLCKHHKSKFVEQHLHFLETALVKLHVNLAQCGIRPQLRNFKSDISEMNVYLVKNEEYLFNQDLFTLITNLIHIDVDDLNVYLKSAQAWHALATILHWQGNLSGALEIWQKLVYGELDDQSFPGVEFYISILSNLSVATSMQTSSRQLASNQPRTATDVKYETPIYEELIWFHFNCALNNKRDDVVKHLLLKFPIPPVYHQARSSQFGFELKSHTAAVVEDSNDDDFLAPSYLLSPTNIITSLYPNHTYLAKSYLQYLCNLFPDTHPENHRLLSNIFLDSILVGLKNEHNTRETEKLRLEFRQFLRRSKFVPCHELLQRLGQLTNTLRKMMNYECAIIEGRLGDHEEALKRLVIEDDDLFIGLDYCMTLITDEHYCGDLKLMSNSVKKYNELAKKLFTIFVKHCLQKKRPDYLNLALKLLNSPEILFDSIHIISKLPPDANIKAVKSFLLKSIRIQVRMLSALNAQYGLSRQEANTTLEQLPPITNDNENVLLETDGNKCSVCTQPIKTHGFCADFVWIMETNELLHYHCYSG